MHISNVLNAETRKEVMSDLHKSKHHDLKDMLNDTSRYLDDIFTIDNPEFEKYIPDLYPAELQLNKANTSDKETSFLVFRGYHTFGV